MEIKVNRPLLSSAMSGRKRNGIKPLRLILYSTAIALLQFVIIPVFAVPTVASSDKTNNPLTSREGLYQEDSSVTVLTVGDEMPDITIKNLFKYKSATARISDFNSRLIILDFWSTYCSSCIPSLKNADSLSGVFKEEVTFLPVTRQSLSVAQTAWKKHGYSLPTATDDRQLQALFPHKFLPHIVWILDGKVKAMTSSKEVNAGNIKAMLATGSVPLRHKADVMDYNPEKPLFINGNGGDGKQLLYYSLIAGHTPGLPAGGGRRMLPGNTPKISYTNFGVVRLYQDAFKDADPFLEFPNRVQFFVPDSILKRLTRQENDPYWSEKNTFSYELQLPGAGSANASKLMQGDLNRFFANAFGFTGHIEKVEVTALALEWQKDNGRLKASAGPPFRKVTDTSYTSSNLPLSDFVRQVASAHSKLETPIVDLTNFSAPVSLQLNAGLKDLKALNRELRKYGLELKEGKRVINMLVFRTTDQSSL